MKKKLALIFVLGVAIAAMMSYMGVDVKAGGISIQLLIVIAVVVLIVIFFVANILGYQKFNQQLGTAMEAMRDGNISRYMELLDDMLRSTKDPNKKRILTVNQALGYAKQKQFAEAAELMERIDLRGLTGLNLTIYYIDYAYYCFRGGRTEKGLAVLEKNRQQIEKFRNHPHIAGLVCIVDVYDAWARGAATADLAKRARTVCRGTDFEDDYKELAQFLKKQSEKDQ